MSFLKVDSLADNITLSSMFYYRIFLIVPPSVDIIQVDAQYFARTYLRQLKTEVINSCLRSGMFYDPLEQEVPQLPLQFNAQ